MVRYVDMGEAKIKLKCMNGLVGQVMLTCIEECKDKVTIGLIWPKTM